MPLSPTGFVPLFSSFFIKANLIAQLKETHVRRNSGMILHIPQSSPHPPPPKHPRFNLPSYLDTFKVNLHRLNSEDN